MASRVLSVPKLRKQFAFLNKLNRLTHKKLIQFHDKVFRGTQWFIQIPRLAHKEFVIRRLWTYYCARNYHYPRGHPTYNAFRTRARKILSKPYNEATDSVYEMAKAQALDHRAFTVQAVKDMPINQVDRILAINGIYVELDEDKRRRLLWEFYNRHTMSSKRRTRNYGRVNNRWFLTDLILANPAMSFDQFRSVFGNDMPAVTRSSFNNARSRLRKVGYQIPVLNRGPSDPAVVNLDGREQRGRRDEEQEAATFQAWQDEAAEQAGL